MSVIATGEAETQPTRRSRARAAQALPLEPIFVDLATTAAAVSLSEASVQKLVREGGFPAPRKVSPGRVAWLLSEIRTWATDRPVSDLLPPATSGRPATSAFAASHFCHAERASVHVSIPPCQGLQGGRSPVGF